MQKTILIYGASKGIGRATAAHLRSKGWDVYGAARTLEELESLAKDCPGIKIRRCDVTNKQELLETLEWARAENGINVIMHSVSNDFITDTPSEDIPDEVMERDHKLYVMSTKWLGDAFKKHCQRRGYGALLVLASRAGIDHDALPGRVAYTAAKRGQIGVSQNLREEMREHGINGGVIVVCPGLVKGTNMVKNWERKHQPKENEGTALPVAVELLTQVIENPSAHDNFLYLLENGELAEIEPAKHIVDRG